MPTNVTAQRIKEFETALKAAGGSSGNSSLRQVLGWDEEFYWKVQGQLIREGRLVAGRGKGGSVRFAQPEVSALASDLASNPPARTTIASTNKEEAARRERDLYAPLKAAIEAKWIQRFALDDVLVAHVIDNE